MENIDIEDKTTWSQFISEDQLWESVEKTTIIYNANKALLIDILLKLTGNIYSSTKGKKRKE